MNALYDDADGNAGRYVNPPQIAEELGLTTRELRDDIKYLEGEKLVFCTWIGGQLLPMTRLTHQGVKEIEAQRSAPDQPTQHLPALNLITIQGDVVNSPLQQGSPGAVQQVDYSIDQRQQVLDFVSVAHEHLADLGLSEDDQAALQAHLTTAEAQSSSPKPAAGLIRGSLQAVKAVLLGAASSEAQTLLLELLNHIPH